MSSDQLDSILSVELSQILVEVQQTRPPPRPKDLTSILEADFEAIYSKVCSGNSDLYADLQAKKVSTF